MAPSIVHLASRALFAGAILSQVATAQESETPNTNGITEHSRSVRFGSGGGFRLNSFVFCRDNNGGCSFPDRTWPAKLNGQAVNPALVIWNEDYNITWSEADPERDVELTWTLPVASEGEQRPNITIPIEAGQTSFIVNFGDLAAEFPTPEYDFEPAEIQVLAGEHDNLLLLTYADQEDGSTVRSDQFAVYDSLVEKYLDVQRAIGEEEEFEAWRLGVGIGVGLGVPIFMAVAFGIGWTVGKRRARSAAAVNQKNDIPLTGSV